MIPGDNSSNNNNESNIKVCCLPDARRGTPESANPFQLRTSSGQDCSNKPALEPTNFVAPTSKITATNGVCPSVAGSQPSKAVTSFVFTDSRIVRDCIVRDPIVAYPATIPTAANLNQSYDRPTHASNFGYPATSIHHQRNPCLQAQHSNVPVIPMFLQSQSLGPFFQHISYPQVPAMSSRPVDPSYQQIQSSKVDNTPVSGSTAGVSKEAPTGIPSEGGSTTLYYPVTTAPHMIQDTSSPVFASGLGSGPWITSRCAATVVRHRILGIGESNAWCGLERDINTKNGDCEVEDHCSSKEDIFKYDEKKTSAPLSAGTLQDLEHAHPFNYPAMIPSADATLLSAPPQVYRPRDLSRVYIPTVQNDTLSSHDPTADGDDTVERGSEPYSSSPQHLNVPLHDAVIFPKKPQDVAQPASGPYYQYPSSSIKEFTAADSNPFTTSYTPSTYMFTPAATSTYYPLHNQQYVQPAALFSDFDITVNDSISHAVADRETLAVKNRIILCGLTLTIPVFLYLRFAFWV